MSSPKGENRLLITGIRAQQVSLTKTTCLPSNQSLSPLYQARRKKNDRCRSEPGHFPTYFNNFIQLLGHLGATLEALFVEIMEDNGAEREKWIPKVACRRRMVLVMHMISLCVRPEGAHKQEIHISPMYFACPRRVQAGQEHKSSRGPGHFGVSLVPLGGQFGVTLGICWLLRGYFHHSRITFESHWLVFQKHSCLQYILMILYNNWVIWGRICDKFS